MFFFIALVVILIHAKDCYKKVDYIEFYLYKEEEDYITSIKEINDNPKHFLLECETNLIVLNPNVDLDQDVHEYYELIVGIWNGLIRNGTYVGPRHYTMKKVEGRYIGIEAFVIGTDDKSITRRMYAGGMRKIINREL